MINRSKSLADKVIFIIIFIFISVNIILFIGGTILTKNTFYKLEKDKAELIATNYAPLIGVNLFLSLPKKIEYLGDKILENDSVIKVVVYDNKKNFKFKKSKRHHKSTIKVQAPLYKPNSLQQIGTLEIYYSTTHFETFMKQYFIFIFFSFVFVILSSFGLYIYIKKQLFPLKRLSYLLKDYNPEIKIDIPYKNQDDEIGLISNAIDISNKKTVEFSKNLQELANILIDANKNLEEKIKEELQVIREKDKQLLQQSRLAQMGEMINMIAHQWRQPLSAISATTSNINFKLMFDDIDKDELTKEIELISQYSQHLSSTIDDFRNFFKENKHKQKIDTQTLIDETLHIARVSIENHKIKIKTNLCCNKEIVTYANEVKQVLLNLLKNAQDALLERDVQDPYIEIGTLCGENDQTYIYVKDNAGGVPSDIKDKIFEPYFSTKLEKDGTGLGLYMSKTIIEDHCGGKLYVENEKDGAKFVIKFDKDADIKKAETGE